MNYKGPFGNDSNFNLTSVNQREIFHQLEFMVNTSKSSMTLIDKDYRYILANHAFCLMVNKNRDEIIGKTVESLWGERIFNDVIRPKIDQAFKGEEVHYEAWFDIDLEEHKCFSVDYYPYYNFENEISHIVVISHDETKRKRMEKIRDAVFKVTESAHSTKNLNHLYSSIHKIISQLMTAENFYISIYDEDLDKLTFPYFVDEFEETPPPQELGKGLTEYVLLNKKAMLVSPDVFVELVKNDEVEEIGAPSIDWLGVPLITKNKAFGVLVVQTYSPGIRYTEEDKNILEFVSRQIAMAIERKRSENKIKDSEKKFRSIIESIPIGMHMYQLEPDGRLIFTGANPAADILLCVDNDQFIGKTIEEAFPGMINTNIPDMYRKVALTGEVWSDDQIIYEDSQIKGAFEVHAFQTAPGHMVASFFDITQRKRSEEALRRNEELFRQLYENSSLGIAMLDKQNKTIQVNKSFERIFGYCQNELRGIHIDELIIPEIYKKEASDLTSRTSRGKIVQIETIRKRKDGSYVNVAISGIPILLDNKIIGIYGIYEDISERKKAELALKESEERFRGLYENSTMGLYRSTPEGDILLANNALIRMLGYDSFQALTKVDLATEGYVNPNSRDLFKELVEENDQIYGFEAEWRKADGNTIFLRESARVVRDENGKAKFYEGTVEDITEKKIVEKEIIKAKEKAEESEKIKSYFLAQISHEIRTPLNTLTNFYSIIRDEITDHMNEDLETSFQIIDNASKRIIRTIDLILNMSALQSGMYEYNPTGFDLYKAVIKNLYSEFKPIAESKSLELELKIETSDTKITADIYCVNQIAINLIDNAIKYTKQGKITISLFRGHGDQLHLQVADTGIGMSNEFLSRIFKPFSQEDQGYSRTFEGNGLGLALVKQYCDLNNAEITIESIKGEGSLFTVIFSNNINAE